MSSATLERAQKQATRRRPRTPRHTLQRYAFIEDGVLDPNPMTEEKVIRWRTWHASGSQVAEVVRLTELTRELPELFVARCWDAEGKETIHSGSVMGRSEAAAFCLVMNSSEQGYKAQAFRVCGITIVEEPEKLQVGIALCTGRERVLDTGAKPTKKQREMLRAARLISGIDDLT